MLTNVKLETPIMKIPWTQGNQNDIKTTQNIHFLKQIFHMAWMTHGWENKSHRFVVVEGKKKGLEVGVWVLHFFLFVKAKTHKFGSHMPIIFSYVKFHKTSKNGQMCLL